MPLVSRPGSFEDGGAWAWRKLAGESRAQLVECEDLAAKCPGDCAICASAPFSPLLKAVQQGLEALSSLPEHLAFSPRGKQLRDVGLLRFPCQHTFHASCADCLDDSRGHLPPLPGSDWELKAMPEDLSSPAGRLQRPPRWGSK